jgi:TolA-binding protein
VYPDPRVVSVITQHFVPVRVHVREQKDEFKRLGDRYAAHWTPTVLIIDPAGEERHRLEGFLPADDFLAQLTFGRARAAFMREDFAEAAKQFDEVLEGHSQSEVAPEAMYWRGVARYKASGDAANLVQAHRDLTQLFPESSWAKKASVWAPAQST